MLVLSRNIGEKIYIGDNITIQVVDVQGRKVKLGVEANKDIPVHREEIYMKIKEAKKTIENLATDAEKV